MSHRGLACAAAIAIAGFAGASGCGGGSDVTTSLKVQVDPASQRPARDPEPTEGTKLAPPPPTILLSGETSEGRGFDYVIYGTTEGPCIATAYAPRMRPGGGACGEGLLPDRVPGGIHGFASSTGTGAGSVVAGYFGPGVDAIRLDYEGATGAVSDDTLAAAWIAPRILRLAGSRPRLGILVAQLPEGVDSAGVTATALDDEGGTIGMASWPDFASE
jgi:hypothetical protein